MATKLLAIYLWILAAGVLVMMARQYARRIHDLLSLRNLFLFGYVHFTLSGTATALLTGDISGLTVENLTRTGFKATVMITVFLIVFLWSYDRGWIAKRLANRLPRTSVEPGDVSMLILAAIMTLIAVGLRFGVKIPYIATIASMAGVGSAAVACGAVGWVWARRLLNPAMSLYGSIIVAVNILTAITGAFGRRTLVAVLGGLLWGMYYNHWRYLSLGKVTKRFVFCAVIPVILVALFSSARNPGEHERTAMEHIREIARTGSLKSGLELLASGGGGGAGLWAIENYPSQFPYRHMMTIWYFLVYDVPRAWWPAKPLPLSILVPIQADVQGVAQGVHTRPAGIIGNAAAEGGWYALIVYAVVGGLFLRFFDQLIQDSVTSPFVVLPMGSALGQSLGLARGETAIFANIFVTSAILVWLFMLTWAKLIERNQWMQAEAPDQANALSSAQPGGDD